MLKSGQSLTCSFVVTNPSGGSALIDADSTPSGTLRINGTDNGASVTVTNQSTGKYKAAVTLPSLSAGDLVEIYIAATLNSISSGAVVFQGVVETKRVSDLNDFDGDLSSVATDADMQRALGLMQENFYLDNPTFDSNNNLLTARVRVYSVAGSVGTDSDVLATYNMTATFSAAGKVTTYKMVKA